MQSTGLLEALGRPVLQRLGRRLLGDPGHLRGEGLRREGRGVGQAAGERDHLRPRRHRHQVAHRRGAHHPRCARRRGRRSAPGRCCWRGRDAGGAVGHSAMRGSVADRRRGAREVRFSRVDFLGSRARHRHRDRDARRHHRHARLRPRPDDAARRRDRASSSASCSPARARRRRSSAWSAPSFACLVVSDVVAGAGRREGSGAGALGFLVSLAALIVVAIALLVAGLVIARRRRPRLARHLPPPPRPAQTRRPARPALAAPPPVAHHWRPCRPPRSWSSPTSTRCAPTCCERAVAEGRAPTFARAARARRARSPTASPASPR